MPPQDLFQRCDNDHHCSDQRQLDHRCWIMCSACTVGDHGDSRSVSRVQHQHERKTTVASAQLRPPSMMLGGLSHAPQLAQQPEIPCAMLGYTETPRRVGSWLSVPHRGLYACRGVMRSPQSATTIDHDHEKSILGYCRPRMLASDKDHPPQ